jgi:hypothetical protein
VQIKQFDSPSFLPNLDALDAEFESKGEQCPTGRSRQGIASMDPTFRPTQSEFRPHVRAAKPTIDATKRSSLDPITIRSSLARRARSGSARFFIIFGLGVGTTLAWQSYGDEALGMISKSSPQLAWVAPKTVPVVPTAPNVVTAAVASPDLQQLALGLAAVRQSVDLLSGQVAAGQQQTGSDIAKLQADGQQILHKLAAAPPRPTAAPTHKPAPVTPPPSPSPEARN